jgi:group I intron endonuclease
MNSGIYLITNTLNGKQYVGQSLGVKKRFSSHKRAARLKLKREAFYLHNAISKHGEDNFKFEVILYATDPDYLNLMEQKVIAGFNTIAPNGYNLDSGGNVNRTMSDVTRQKLCGRTPWNKGMPKSEEAKRKQSLAMMGKPSPQKGKPRTAEEKAKQSVAMKGRVAWNKGIPMSEEQKNKLRLVDKSYTKTPEYRAMMSIAVKSAKSKLKE